jgi:hypothetical protein
VGHTKDPAAQFLAPPFQPEMPKEGKEHFLSNLLRVGHADAKRQHIPQNRISILVKETDNLTFDLGGPV